MGYNKQLYFSLLFLTSHYAEVEVACDSLIFFTAIVLTECDIFNASKAYIASKSPTSHSVFLDPISLLERSPWEIPTSSDLLSQVQGSILHPCFQIWKLWVWPQRWPTPKF